MQMPSLHCAFAPHGDGLQGSVIIGTSVIFLYEVVVYKIIAIDILSGGLGKQFVNGSPVYPSTQLQIGT